MNENWLSIQFMPYIYFLKTIEWKMDLEEQRKKAIEEKNREQEAFYKQRMNAQKAEAKRAQRARR